MTHKEYRYKPSEVLRYEQELPESFIPHSLFRLDFMPSVDEMAGQHALETASGPERRRSERLVWTWALSSEEYPWKMERSRKKHSPSL